MGYCYYGRQLCCDVCGNPGGVRKHRCPFGWCPAIALCPKCKREHPEYTSKKFHREHGCEQRMVEVHQREAEEQRILKEGKLLRRSALQHKDGVGFRIKVIFRGLKDIVRAFWMAPRTYRAIALGVPATVEDYRALGKVTRARNTDIYDPEGRK